MPKAGCRMTTMQHPLIRYHGGKFRMADWIISQFPVHKTYVEPFGGGAAVLLAKPPSQVEVYNDLDSEVVNLFRVLRDPEQRLQLAEQIDLTPFSRAEFVEAYLDTDCPVEKARRLIVRAQMGFGSAGATKGSTGFRMAGGRQKNYEIDLWNNYSQRLAIAAIRLKKVLIENRDYREVIDQFDSADTLFFVDPPYVRSTRNAKTLTYQCEMTDGQHVELLELLNQVKGKVILSGYDCELYNKHLAGWKKLSRSVQASGNRGGVTRTECLWINPAAQVPDLFTGGAA